MASSLTFDRFPQPAVGRMGTAQVQRPAILNLKAQGVNRTESTVKGKGRSSNKAPNSR